MIELALVVLFGLFFLAMGLWLVVSTGYHAYRRGYNPIVWVLAVIIAVNPIFLFVVLAMSPHRRRLRMREDFAAELDAKLVGIESHREGSTGDAIPANTRTVPPRALDATRTYLD